jgi:hypothetical protein
VLFRAFRHFGHGSGQSPLAVVGWMVGSVQPEGFSQVSS